MYSSLSSRSFCFGSTWFDDALMIGHVCEAVLSKRGDWSGCTRVLALSVSAEGPVAFVGDTSGYSVSPDDDEERAY